MARRTVAIAISLATLLAALSVAPAAAVDPPLPSTMAAVGDSITQAASTGSGGLGADAPQNSWSTGTSASVNSHNLRLRALNPTMGAATNLSVSGAKMFDLAGQMTQAAALRPDYLTVLIGGNDVCTSTEGSMTDVGVFRDQFLAAMAALRAGSPTTQVYVVSIPRVMGLYELFKDSGWARFIWSIGGVCQSLLASPTSTAQADVDRRARVAQRNVDFNAVLAEVCALGTSQPCRTDGGAVYNTAFAASDVSGDYFHPSAAGQAKLASVSWSAGYWAGAVPPPPPNQPPRAAFGFSCTGLTCNFTDQSTDTDGTIATRAWDFGGVTSALPNPTHTFGATGTHRVTLTVTDNLGAPSTTFRDVTVTAIPKMTVVDPLTATTARKNSNWTATVIITVRSTDGAAVSGALVSATWSIGAPDTCTTGSTGQCNVTSDPLRHRSVESVTMRIANVTHSTLQWDQAPRQITVNRPS